MSITTRRIIKPALVLLVIIVVLSGPARLWHRGISESDAVEPQKSTNPSRAIQTSSTYKIKTFTIEGRIIDKKRILLQGMMEEGAIWSGELDRVGRNVVEINAYSNDKKLISVHPNDKGGFTFSSTYPITHISVEVPGGGFFFRKDGHWEKNAIVDFVLDKEIFTIDGYVRNMDGTFQKGEMVSAYDDSNSKITFAYTNSKGYFKIWSNRRVSFLKSMADRLQVIRKGPWSRNSTVTLKLDEQNLFTINGSVTDGGGRPIKGVLIYASVVGGGNKSTTTDANGYYEIAVDRKIKALHAYRKITGEKMKKDGPWEKESKVNFVLTKGGVFTLKGRVTDINGNPVSGAFVSARDEILILLKSTRTDRNGYYILEVGRKVKILSAYRHPIEPKIDIIGPWSSDATVNIRLKR